MHATFVSVFALGLMLQGLNAAPIEPPQALDARGPKQFSASTCTSIQNELAAGAAAFAAAKEYEANCQANGKASGHAQAKEILAGIAGGHRRQKCSEEGCCGKKTGGQETVPTEKPAAKKPTKTA